MRNEAVRTKDADTDFDALDGYIDSLPVKEGALIPVLHRAQQLYGYLSRETQTHIAERLKIPASKVYGVVTFYSYFATEQKGKYQINICMGTACFVRGAEDVARAFAQELSIGMAETTEDRMFTLDSIRCVGACGLAPVVMVNDKVYGRVKPEDVKGIVEECLAGTEG